MGAGEKRPSPKQDKMAQCSAIKSNGDPCTRRARDDDFYCTIHKRVEDRRTRNNAIGNVWITILDRLWGHGARVSIRDLDNIVMIALENGEIDGEGAMSLTRRITTEWDFYLHIHGGREPVQPKSDLHVLALDAQNVHTKEVNKQTAETIELLLATDIPAGQATLQEILGHWTDKQAKSLRAVRKDMKRWYRTTMCREPDDRLYARILDGLWARIKISPAKPELIKRLWEECRESLRMCCEGHISRLCNVFVGFDDAFKAPISVGEILQQRMAVIAEKDVRTEYKVGDAWAVFEELGIPMEQRMDWINAL